MLHGGWPGGSFDYRQIISRLEDDYFIAALDFPGYGFSDKPQDGYSYMVEDDAKLVDHFVREVVGLSQFHLLTHSRGSSVGLSLLGNHFDDEASPYEITYHFISNANIFLPLGNNSQGQYDLLDPELGPELIRQQRAEPRVTEGTPEQVAWADILAFNDGIGARFYIGRHLLERAENDFDWLDNLRRSPIPTALIWGLQDTVSPIRIANHVWLEYLEKRAVESSYWILPTVVPHSARGGPRRPGDDHSRLPGRGDPGPGGRGRLHVGAAAEPEPERDRPDLRGPLHHPERPLPLCQRVHPGWIHLLSRPRVGSGTRPDRTEPDTRMGAPQGCPNRLTYYTEVRYHG